MKFFQLFWLFVAIIALAIRCHRMPLLEIVTCEVGQGDAILIKHGEFRMLIDTGPNSAIRSCLQANTFLARRKIDVIVLTHFDADHIGGLSAVLNWGEVGEIWWSGATTKETALATDTTQLLADLSQAGVVVRQVKLGDTLVRPGWRARVVWDGAALGDSGSVSPPGEDENVRSIGLYIMGETFGFLSLGDLESREELAVTTTRLLGPVTVLKTSHHGAKTATLPEFLQKISPETAIISVGRNNKYHHPEEITLRNLVNQGIVVLRTDIHGEIHYLPTAQKVWSRLD